MSAPPGPPTSGSFSTDQAGAQKRKLVIGLVVGSLFGLAILAAIYFLFLKGEDDPQPTGAAGEIAGEEIPEEGGEAPVGEEPAFDSIAPLLAETAGPYTLLEQSSEPCEPPCIFPDAAHSGSTETLQARWDAGTAESGIYGEFLLYGTVEEAQAALSATAADLEARGFEAIDTFTLQGVDGTTYQDAEGEVLLWGSSNLMMGLYGSKGFPTEMVGYL